MATTVKKKPLAALEDRFPKLGRGPQAVLITAIAIFAVIFPLLMDPISGTLADATQYLAYVVMGLGLNIVVGFAGLLDLGYVAFYAVGAYCSGWLMSSFYADANIHILVTGTAAQAPGVHVNFLLVLVIAAMLCAVAGVIIGLPTLRLRGDYIAIVTLAFGEIVHVFAVNGDGIHPFGVGYPLTKGRDGISPIDQIKLPGLSQFNSYLNLRPYYWTILAIAAIAIFISLRLRDSRLGRAWIAIREDEVAAASMGIPLVKTKLQAYAIGAALGGVSGAFLGPYLQIVNADSFAFSFSIFVIATIILGGLGSVWGVVLGSILLSYINYTLIPDQLNSVPHKIGLDFNLADVSIGIFGVLLLFVMLIRPEGLLPERRRKIELTEGIGAAETSFEVST
ncbi:branched-chain amino acid ABC transporter permease [Paraconexibacter antarcticus]|uniref:Branched-chain amino acid ABC transporter permease n=1 Tax=Paraconexibacter antarcticus TaxID=2949664 RepID=A0ABY5DNL3_9ACTN|nr:branched-chain amino acid ABC transporter permease [Paraconexibacter antarcticus]UTI62446.1 branched-chain amino acid ABC transporter permease [Paraconexibacter antarcticus]